MKITLGQEYMTNVQGTSLDININAKAMDDTGTVTILERILNYAINTENEGWRELTTTRLKEQAIEFQNEAQKLVDVMNLIMNISADVEKDLGR